MKAARKLARRNSRAEVRLFLAEGTKALVEALELPGCVVEVFATVAATAAEPELRAAVEEAGLPWQPATDDAVASLAGAQAPQGVVAVCRYVDRPVEVVLTGRTVVICADVRDPGNAGTIIRTADAAGVGAVVLAGSSVDPYNDKTVRATVGSLFHVPIATGIDVLEAIATAQAAGYRVLAADGSGETDLFAAGDLLAGPVAWLFGNEAWGLPAEIAAAADHRVSIPIYGRAESLNLATAAAVCLYASAQARGTVGE
ncbi:RNA methyltransferase [Nocardioides marmoriginsengisoli]|uniref:RNA methyltransferase n=1 Tax=Nocardioides marmoriginsengisoli TaxID=661483 RepID=A0A3N0CLQ4_9ACTN|nr:RNA methyltransferase [Nocardioides marmoriginsengisoli]